MTDQDKIKIARKAVLHTLKRIQTDKDIAYKMGPGSASFELLTAACAVLCDQSVDEVRNNVIPGSAGIPQSTPEEILADL